MWLRYYLTLDKPWIIVYTFWFWTIVIIMVRQNFTKHIASAYTHRINGSIGLVCFWVNIYHFVSVHKGITWHTKPNTICFVFLVSFIHKAVPQYYHYSCIHWLRLTCNALNSCLSRHNLLIVYYFLASYSIKFWVKYKPKVIFNLEFVGKEQFYSVRYTPLCLEMSSESLRNFVSNNLAQIGTAGSL